MEVPLWLNYIRVGFVIMPLLQLFLSKWQMLSGYSIRSLTVVKELKLQKAR